MAYSTNKSHYVTNQPVTGNPFDQLNGKWTVGLCNCCDDVSQCCYAYWCWCCFLGSLSGKINESKLSCCCVPGVLGFYRMKVRTVYKIKGDSCNDYCVTGCCPFCAGLQMMNEISNRSISEKQTKYQINSTVL